MHSLSLFVHCLDPSLLALWIWAVVPVQGWNSVRTNTMRVIMYMDAADVVIKMAIRDQLKSVGPRLMKTDRSMGKASSLREGPVNCISTALPARGHHCWPTPLLQCRRCVPCSIAGHHRGSGEEPATQEHCCGGSSQGRCRCW